MIQKLILNILLIALLIIYIKAEIRTRKDLKLETSTAVALIDKVNYPGNVNTRKVKAYKDDFKYTQTAFVFFQEIDLSEEYQRIEGISQAIADVIDEFFIRQKILFYVTVVTPISSEYKQIIDRTFAKIKEIQPIFVNQIGLLRRKIQLLTASEVRFQETSHNDNFLFYRYSNQDTRKLKLLKIQPCQYLNFYNFKRLKSEFLKENLGKIYSYYICQRDDDTKIDLKNYEWFDVDNCNQQKLKVLNTFDIKTQKWQKTLKNHEKFKNFHGCRFKFQESSLIHKDRSKKYLSTYGEFMHVVAERANFTLEVARFKDEIDLNVGSGYAVYINKNYVLTSPVWTINIGLMVTKGEPYTEYEKLLLPFDELTWFLFLGTFFKAFMFIFIINRMNKKIQTIVYGENVTMPAYNVVGTFFGIGQTKLPEASFARFILLMFIIFCLIFRTAYQGVLFDFMNSDMRKPHAKTIDEVFDNNFTIISYKAPVGDFFYNSVYGKKRELINNNILKSEYFEEVCSYIRDDKIKTAIVTEENFDVKVRGSCKQEILRIKETVLTLNGGLSMEPFHYLYNVVESTMQMMLQAGIVQYFYEYYHWNRFGRFHIEEISNIKVLSMSDLSYGFNIWLLVCLVSIIEFSLEMIVGKLRKRKEKSAKKSENNQDLKLKNENRNFEESKNSKIFDLDKVFKRNKAMSPNESSINLNSSNIELKLETQKIDHDKTQAKQNQRISQEEKSNYESNELKYPKENNLEFLKNFELE